LYAACQTTEEQEEQQEQGTPPDQVIAMEEGAGKSGGEGGPVPPRGNPAGAPSGSRGDVTVMHWTVVDICGARSWG